MKRTEPMHVGALLEEYFRDRALGPATMEGRAVELWAEVVGGYVAGYTEDVYIRAGVIYVTFSSPSVRSEIFMRRKTLVGELNARLGKKVVKNIVIR